MDVGTISAPLKIIDDNVRQVVVVDVNKEVGQRISKQLIRWINLITYDRRKKYIDITVSDAEAKAVNFLGTGYVINEVYLADTASWVLPKPLFIGEGEQHKFYLGSQLGNMGQTIVCENCKSAIKFYWPDQESDSKVVSSILTSSKCPLCRNEIIEPDETAKIRGEMTKLMAKFKYEIGESFA